MRGLLSLGLLCWLSTVAWADGEGWLIGEGRLPVYQQANARNRIRLRLATNFRIAGRTGGVQQALSRVGMTWEPSDILMLATQTVLAATSNDGQKFGQEIRQELDATVTTQPLRFLSQSHRQRLELRWAPGWVWARYRVLQRLSVGPPSWRVQPFVFDEVFFDGREGLNQNRVGVGVSVRVRRNLRIEVGYLWRLRKTSPSDFTQDHALRLAFTLDPSFESAGPPHVGSD